MKARVAPPCFHPPQRQEKNKCTGVTTATTTASVSVSGFVCVTAKEGGDEAALPFEFNFI